MDNIYARGSLCTAKNNPSLQLVIARYLGRIYYCIAVDDPSQKLLAFFERELNPPAGDLLSSISE